MTQPNFIELGRCYGHMKVAIGRADIMFDPILNIWDAAALPNLKSRGVFSDAEGCIHPGNGFSNNKAHIQG